MTKEKFHTIKLPFKLIRHSEINVFDSVQLQNKRKKYSHFHMLRKCICGPISILLNQRKLKTEQRFSRLIRAYQVVKGLWLVAYLIVRYELFPMMFESRINMSILITLIHHSAGYPSQYNKTKEKSKLQTMKDMKLLIILGNMIAHVQNQKIYTNTKIL